MTRCTCAIVMVVLLTPANVRAQQPADTVPDIGWTQFAVGAGLIAGLVVFDPPIARAEHGAASAGTLTTARQFDRMGNITGLGPVIAGLAIAGWITHNRAVRHSALQAAVSVALASVVAEGGKYLVGRLRPYADPDFDAVDFRFYSGSPSFPSGHTTAAFALATSLGDAIGNTWVRIGLYGLATGTAWARITEERHWLSDVVAGAAIGTLSAKFVSGKIRLFGLRAPRVVVSPHGAGMRWTIPAPGH